MLMWTPILAGGTLNSPSTLDLKVSSLIDLAKEYASVDLLKAGEFNLSVTATDGIELQSAGGDAISKVEVGINIVDEGEIFQASSNAVTLSVGDEGADGPMLQSRAEASCLFLTRLRLRLVK